MRSGRGKTLEMVCSCSRGMVGPHVLTCEQLPREVTSSVSKIRRGGYVFIAWTGDHEPRHVHVYRDAVMVVKWDLENDIAMRGRASARVRELIAELKREGLL